MDRTKELDQFYTNIKVIPELMKEIDLELKRSGIDPNEVLWLEPSAGSGNFIRELKHSYGKDVNYKAFDIDPKNNVNKDIKIIHADFLKIKKEDLKAGKRDVITFGNPPFGKRGKLAVDFINKASEFSDMIALILPNIFVRYLTQKNINANLKLVRQVSMPKNSFTVNDSAYNVNCVFQIWVNDSSELIKNVSNKRDLRQYEQPQKTHEDFTLYIHNNTKQTEKFFVKKNFGWDFAIYRQGYYDYSNIFTKEEELIKNRQYLFIKFNEGKKKYKNLVKKMDLNSMTKWSTSVPGFSNEDFIKEYIRTKKNEGKNNGK